MGRKPEKKLGKQEPKAWPPAHQEGGALGAGQRASACPLICPMTQMERRISGAFSPGWPPVIHTMTTDGKVSLTQKKG